MNDYMLECAVNTLRGAIAKEWSAYFSPNNYAVSPFGAMTIHGMEEALKIIEAMMYEEAQMRVETAGVWHG